MNDREKQALIGTVVTVVLIAVIAIILFFSCRGKDDFVMEEPPRSAPKPEPEKVEELPEFLEIKEFYPEGEVSAVYYVYRVKPDVRHKMYTAFYRAGAKKFEYEYCDNVRQGPLVFWYEDGKKALEGAFLDDKRHGEFREHHPNGNLKLVYRYEKGELEGAWTEYYDDGMAKMIEKSFKGGKLDGKYVHYTREGAVKEQTYFKDGLVSRPVEVESEE